MNQISKNRAAVELILAGVLWGYGFIATKWALVDFSVFDLIFYRYLIAFLVFEFYLVLFHRHHFLSTLKECRLALWPGLLMASFIIPQTIGLQYTTATKSGFITTLYVLIVPLLNQTLFKVKIDRKFYGLAFLAVLGTIFLLDLFSATPDIVVGDLWTLGCAFMAALHIIVIGILIQKSKSAFRFNSFQNFWTLICVLPFFLMQEKITWHSSGFLPWFGIISIAIGSSIIAFSIQIRAQKVLSPETASQFFLLESPFAFLFGYLFLNETLSAIQVIGAVIILTSTYLTLKLEQTSHSK